MKKFLGLSLLLLLVLAVLTGCGGDKATTDEATTDEQVTEETVATEETTTETDVVTTASTVNENEGFINAISASGTWIIVTLNDLTLDQELVVEGEFYDKGDSANELYRKIAPYTQDEEHNVIDRFTITAPKMTIKSPNTKFQGGTFVGDIYVEANGFVIQDATVEGNVYFASEEYQTSFDMSNQGTVTGVTQVQ